MEERERAGEEEEERFAARRPESGVIWGEGGFCPGNLTICHF